MISHWQARLIYRQHFPGESETEERAQEFPSAWYFPRSYIGSCGLVIDKQDGHIHVFGSAFSLETWLWAYERGFRHDTCDLVIPEVYDLSAAVALLEGLDLSQPGCAYLPRRAYTREQLLAQVSRLPARFVNQNLWMHFGELRALDAAGLPFRLVVEADTHSIAPPGTPVLLLSPSVLMPLAHDEALRQALLRRRDRGELDVIVRAEDFARLEGSLTQQWREARQATRGSGPEQERRARIVQALDDLEALRSIPCRRAGGPVQPPIPPEARLISDLADLQPWR